MIDVKNDTKLRVLRKGFHETELRASVLMKRQRKHYNNVNENTLWRNKNKKIESLTDTTNEKNNITENEDVKNENMNFFQSSVGMTKHSKDVISNHSIAFADFTEINGKSPHKSIITVVEFHPNGQLLMIAGFDGMLQIYQMSGEINSLLKRIIVSDLPIREAHFTPDGKEIVITGRRHYFYTFDLISFQMNRIDRVFGTDFASWEQFWCSPNNIHFIFTGALGTLLVMSRQTKKIIKTLHISQKIAAITFNNNGNYMYVLTNSAGLYVYAMNNFQCVDYVEFVGIADATSLAIYPALSLVAVGCRSGVVSLYSYGFIQNVENAKNFMLLLDTKTLNTYNGNATNNTKTINPLYSIENLLTPIAGISFNHDGQLLLIYSKLKENSVRLVHVASGRVYANWPQQTNLGRVQVSRFSPHSGYLVIGNDFGYVRLMRLFFYPQC